MLSERLFQIGDDDVRLIGCFLLCCQIECSLNSSYDLAHPSLLSGSHRIAPAELQGSFEYKHYYPGAICFGIGDGLYYFALHPSKSLSKKAFLNGFFQNAGLLVTC
jgi:hypothetical protein